MALSFTLNNVIRLHNPVLRKLRPYVYLKSLAGFCVQSLSTRVQNSSKWDLVSSVCVERTPIVSRDLTALEQQFQSLQSRVEFECSLKSDHELRNEQESKLAELIKKGQAEEADFDQATKTTAQDFEDACQDELVSFQFANRFSDDLKKNDINRKLHHHLLLFVKQNIGDDVHWLLPQVKWTNGETIRQAAERAVKTVCGEDLKVLYLGNAPWGFYKYKYPLSLRKVGGPEGVKIFFFKALYQSGDIKNHDFQWLSRKEASKSVQKEYFKSIDQFLLFE